MFSENQNSKSNSESGRLEEMKKYAAARGFSFYEGHIETISQDKSGVKFVSFADDNLGGWGSAWSDWAFDLAKSALLYGKKVKIFANGDPVGANLELVIISKENI